MEPIPLAPPAAKGWPYPGQTSGGQEQGQGSGGDQEQQQPKTLWQQYGGYVLPIVIAYAVMNLLGGGGGKDRE
jgi:hypothetical protein